MKQKSESVFDKLKKHAVKFVPDCPEFGPEEGEFMPDGEIWPEEEDDDQTAGDSGFYVTNNDLYQDYLKGSDRAACFKPADRAERLSGTLYYKDRDSDVIYDMKAQFDDRDSDSPVLLLPCHAFSALTPVFIGIVGREAVGKTTLITEITAVGERLLYRYSAAAQCQIDIDYPVASAPYIALRDKRDAFLQGILPPPTTGDERPNDPLYPFFIRSSCEDAFFVFRDFSGKILTKGGILPPRFRDFIFVIDAEDVIRGLKDPFYYSGNEEILSKMLSFIPEDQMDSVFIHVVIAKTDLLQQYLESTEQEDAALKTAEQLQKEGAAKSCIRNLLAPVAIDNFEDQFKAHHLACQELIRLADPIFMNRLELNLVMGGTLHYLFSGVSALGKSGAAFDPAPGNFDVQNLQPINIDAFLYGLLRTYGVFKDTHEAVDFFEEAFQDETELTDIAERLEEIYIDTEETERD